MEESRGYPRPIGPGVTRVGWIGAGVMGAAMAARLRTAGYAVAIYARTPSKADHLRRLGAHLVPSPADAARSADVLFTMVGHPSDVREALLDPASGALAAIPPGGVLVDCTSSDPALAREVAAAARARGCWAVDAPVSGGDVGARDGTLAILAGGDEGVVHWLLPLFEALGRATWMGPAGSGQSSKIANQITIGGTILGLSEAIVFAGRAGLDVPRFLDAVRGGAAGSRAMEIFGERMARRDFAPGGFAEYMVKDLGMGLRGGEDGGEEETGKGVVLPGAALCQQLYLAMVANGDGKMGGQGLITVIERLNGKHA
ncbi:hypothetical protein C4D60_Mb09t05980 [Musa balbisiana]|uniref:6-phosphogluconate dehydrogenase NADP-binding domain-containing protein n=1 Tax=Musa balbisiana TaxID=52838 RepID=A0A4S8IEC3_MUSBA|nr:hypothetical protein C4D60_Mb09t05980 [Musa balbisiana]